MVDLSRLMRKVSLLLYTLPCTIQERLSRALQLDSELDEWLLELPMHLQPSHEVAERTSLKARQPANYITKQSIVLMLRKTENVF